MLKIRILFTPKIDFEPPQIASSVALFYYSGRKLRCGGHLYLYVGHEYVELQVNVKDIKIRMTEDFRHEAACLRHSSIEYCFHAF